MIYYVHIHTLLTGDSSIFKVRTVMNTKWVTRTVHKSGLSPSTAHLVQEDGSSSPAKVGTGPGNCTCGDKSTLKQISILKHNYDVITHAIESANTQKWL